MLNFSVIIAYYKNPIALELILMALKNQSYAFFEIIIAEDDIKSHFNFIEPLSLNQKIKHICQDSDEGFRKTSALNKAIAVSSGDFIIFIDGDCIPSKNFILGFANHASEDSILFGRRIMLSQSITKQLYNHKNLKMLSIFSLWKSKSTHLRYMIYLPFLKQKKHTGVWGHNWGVHKKHLLTVNGFDEDYVHAGVGEDVDIEWRLLQLGLKLYSIRYSAVQYHLYHPENYTSHDVNLGKNLLQLKKESGHIRCLNGLEKKFDKFK